MSNSAFSIRPVRPEDAGALAAIYNYYITQTVATFETEEIGAQEMSRRMDDTSRRPWLVWEEEGLILGYAYASPWKARAAYKQTMESTIYLRQGFGGRGLGRMLYEALLKELKEMDIHAVLAGIALPNESSVNLHEHLGYEHVGTMREVGYKQGRWVDVGYWELLL